MPKKSAAPVVKVCVPCENGKHEACTYLACKCDYTVDTHPARTQRRADEAQVEHEAFAKAEEEYLALEAEAEAMVEEGLEEKLFSASHIPSFVALEDEVVPPVEELGGEG